jgi:hypothetical protein
MALWQGALLRALVDGNTSPVRHAREAVRALLLQHTSSRHRRD